MKQPAEKNFNILISLLLEGLGVGLILVPSHLNLTNSGFPVALHGFVGLLCFFSGLSLQVISVWNVSKIKTLLIKVLACILLIAAGGMILERGQPIGAFTFFAAGAMQLFLFSPVPERLHQINFYHLAIVFMTFSAGMILPVSELDFSTANAIIPYLAALFLITAFFGGATVILPAQKYGEAINRLQIIPWLIIAFLILSIDSDNLIAPAAIIGMLVVERLIPWERLQVPEEDILSRRVVMIAFFAELALLIFMGALLFTIDSGYESNAPAILTVREATLAFFILFSVMLYYATSTVIMTTSGLISELNKTGNEPNEDAEFTERAANLWSHRLDRYLRPFIMTAEGIRGRIQAEQVNKLSRQVGIEKKRNAQLMLLLELSQQLENQLDQPVSAQLAVNTLERAINCGLALIFIHEHENKEFMLLAATGNQKHLVPVEYRQDADKGVIGRTLRQRKTQIVNDIRLDPDFIAFKGETNLSLVAIPLIYNGHVHGVITLNNEKANAFSGLEIGLAETVAAELVRAWERSGYHQRLKYLIQTGSQLSSALDPETTAKEVASISRDITQAKFTYIYIQLGQEREYIQSAFSGDAPLLLESLTDTNSSDELFKLALHASQPFRIRDIRKYEKTSHLKLDNAGLRSLLVIPIRWHQVNIGAILAFGKQREVFFTENDESLAELISIQASGAFESTWLQQELRASLRITSLLYRLSNQIIQAENIEDAASDIAQTAHKLGKNFTTGIVLLDSENEVIAKVKIDEDGSIVNSEHPMQLIQNTMNSGQMIEFSLGESILRTFMPIQTSVRRYGVIWMDTHEESAKPAASSNDLQALINQAAIALERSLLLVESRRQAMEIKSAYDMLEATYDQTLASLTSALDARDRETEGHSVRVTQIASKLGEALGYSQELLKILERGSLLHDIGKIGISDTILHKPGALTKEEWAIMKLHPDIGAKIVAGIPFLQDTIPLIRHHQERWDGTGYPGGLKGTEIPELARLFAVIDAFDALTSNRPYRQKISKEEALEYLREQSGILFDPSMVSSFGALLQKNPELLLISE
jgi:HD-GYP domain-containing protein (c-di-GMP phosphodiesterase class II)/putative methionine-R-sulfoxide reductase with GAF domain